MHVLDTDVVTFIDNRKNDNVANWLRSVDETSIYISVIAVMEISKGVERARRNGDVAKAEQTMAVIKNRFSDRLLSLDWQSAADWGKMLGEQEKNTLDTGVAAIAKRYGYTVATRNTKHYANRGVRLINPFRYPKS